MGFRKQVLLQKELDENDNDDFPLFSHLQDLIDITLCKTGDKFHNISCLKRQCDNCGVQILKLLNEEIDVSESALNVKWGKFEYFNVSVKGGKTIKTLQQVAKETKAGVLFPHLKQLLINFPSHQHSVSWQNEQLKNLVSNLPLGSYVCVHDFPTIIDVRNCKSFKVLIFKRPKFL
jgi:hypothetical protein